MAVVCSPKKKVKITFQGEKSRRYMQVVSYLKLEIEPLTFKLRLLLRLPLTLS